MDAFNSFTDFYHAEAGPTKDFWDRPENARHVDEKMVRFVLFLVIKLVVQKEKILPQWKSYAEQYFFSVMLLNGMIECGSMAAALDAAKSHLPSLVVANTVLEKKHARWAFGNMCISDVALSSYYGLLFVLNELTACGCLREELRQEAKRSPHTALFACALCGKMETSIRLYRQCSGCKIAVYCSQTCHEKDWKDGSHRQACKSVRALVALVRSHDG
jgi:hypothetical protein